MIDKIRNEMQYGEVMSFIETHIIKATKGGGFRKPDVPFLKAIHAKPGIDGSLILERV